MIIAAVAIDTGIGYYYEKKLDNVTKEILTEVIEEDLTEDRSYLRAKNIYEKNKIDTEFLSIKRTEDNKFTIYNSTKHYSFLGNFFHNGTHQSAIEAEGYKDGSGEIVITLKKDLSDESK